MPRTNNEETHILLDVALDGSFNLEVVNGDGVTCTDFSQQIEEALGTVTGREFKPEYEDRTRTAQVTQTQQNRLRQ